MTTIAEISGLDLRFQNRTLLTALIQRIWRRSRPLGLLASSGKQAPVFKVFSGAGFSLWVLLAMDRAAIENPHAEACATKTDRLKPVLLGLLLRHAV